MNKLWRFGDSYSQTEHFKYKDEQNHSEFVAQHYELQLEHLGFGGLGILDCLTRMLDNSHQMKKGDMILINLPAVERRTFININGDIVNTSQFEDSEVLKNDEIRKVVTEDWYDILVRGYIHLMSTFLNSCIKNEIDVFVFTNQHEDFTLPLPNKVKFKEADGWVDAMKEMGIEDLSDKGNLHYLYGKQEYLSKRIIEVIENEKENRRRTT